MRRRVPRPRALPALAAEPRVDLAERQGHAGWFLPVPATFVLDRRGIVRWAFLDVDFTRRAEPDDILAALTGL